MTGNVQMVVIEKIRVLNPRSRDPEKLRQLVDSIRFLGLKRPIKVSRRIEAMGEDPGLDLVYGQGRMEAFKALGRTEIPAIIVEVTREDRLLMSLVENIHRRRPVPMALIHEVERLQSQGHSHSEIGRRLNIDNRIIGGLMFLRKNGEECLLDAVLHAKISLALAVDISKTEDPEAQRGLLQAYQEKTIGHSSIRSIKRIVDQRQLLGKGRTPGRQRVRRTSSEELIHTYRKQAERQKIMVKKAKVCEAKLLFIRTTFKKLLRDDAFVSLLRAEQLNSMPKALGELTSSEESA